MKEATAEEVKTAHEELKKYIVKGLFDFTEKYCAPQSNLYPNAIYIMKSCLIEALEGVRMSKGLLYLLPRGVTTW